MTYNATTTRRSYDFNDAHPERWKQQVIGMLGMCGEATCRPGCAGNDQLVAELTVTGYQTNV